MFSPQMNLLTSKINVFLVAIFISLGNVLFSQNSDEANCGHVTSPKTLAFYKKIKPQLKAYEETFLSTKSAKGLSGLDLVNSIPVKIYILRNSDGSGGISTSEINSAFADLNASFSGSLLEFFVCDGIEYIDDSESTRFVKGDEQRFIETNYVPGLINLYFADYIENEFNDPICGFSDNVGRNDVVILKSACANNGSSLTHEMGHFFSLLHTHGTNNIAMTTELVDGSNCDSDGDGICDTPADPRLKSSNVDNRCNYTGKETDANGDRFNPDTRNIMSYSNKRCRTQFSEQQMARMYAFYMTTKNYLSCPSLNADIAVNERVTCDSSLTVNFESLSEQVTLWEWDVDGDGVIDYTTKNPTHTYEPGIYDVTLTVSDKSKTIRKKYTNLIKVGTDTKFLNEDFEDFNMLDKHGWTSVDASGNGYNWYSNFGDTQSRGTGPSKSITSEDTLNTYMYTEASGSEPGDVAEFISPCIDVNFQNSELEFSYHMFGIGIGELHVDIKTESGYVNDVIEPIIGSQQAFQDDKFITTIVSLSSFTNETINVRFRAVRGPSWEGDIAIDNIYVNTVDTSISDERYKAYPNPMKDDLLYVKNNDFENISTYTVTNLVGQPFLSGTLDNNPIDFSNLSSGTYLLVLTNGTNRVVKKIIK